MPNRDRDIVSSLRLSYEAFSRGEFDTAMSLAHPDIEFVPLGGQSPIKGSEALRAWMEPEALEDQRIELGEIRTNGDKVLVRHKVRARGAASGIELDVDTWAVWTFDGDGRATRLEAFLVDEESDALDAAGLSAPS